MKFYIQFLFQVIIHYKEDHKYDGVYGKYSLGLGFYKFFCLFDDFSRCYTSIAYSLFGYPTDIFLRTQSPLKDFATVLQEFLCPTQSSPKTDCLLNTQKSMPLFRGNEAQCEISGCKTKVVCQKVCQVIGPRNIGPFQLWEERDLYLKGFKNEH